MNEVLRFNYKGTELYIFEENNKFIYLKQQDNNVSQDLTSEEKEVMTKVLLQIMPSRNLSDLGYIKYNQKKFRHFYDLRTGFHVFYEGDNFKTPNDKDLYNLNMVFNYENDYVSAYRYMSQDDKKKNTIKRIVRIGSLTLVVLVSLTGIKLGIERLTKEEALVLNSGEVVEETFADYEAKPIVQSEINQNNVENISRSILTNSNLNEPEKRLFLSSTKFIEDISPYFNTDRLYSLNHFKINFTDKEGPDNARATWQDVFLEMVVYNTKGLETASVTDLTHEFIHIFSNVSNLSLGNSLYEAITTTLNNEYFGNYDKSYNWLNRFAKPLMELLGRDTLLAYYANPNPNILTTALMEINPDFNMAYRLLSNLDTFNNLWKNSYDANFQEQYGELMNQVITELSQTLEVYYDSKYTNNDEFNLICLYHINKERAILEIATKSSLSDETIENLKMYPDTVRLVQENKIFNQDDNASMIINFPDTLHVTTNYYTKDELLMGIDGIKYDRLCDIDLPLTDKGYMKVNFSGHAVDYKVPGNYQKVSKNSR